MLAVRSAEGTNTEPAFTSHVAGVSLGKNHVIHCKAVVHCCGFYEVTLEHQGVLTDLNGRLSRNSQAFFFFLFENCIVSFHLETVALLCQICPW